MRDLQGYAILARHTSVTAVRRNVARVSRGLATASIPYLERGTWRLVHLHHSRRSQPVQNSSAQAPKKTRNKARPRREDDNDYSGHRI